MTECPINAWPCDVEPPKPIDCICQGRGYVVIKPVRTAGGCDVIDACPECTKRAEGAWPRPKSI